MSGGLLRTDAELEVAAEVRRADALHGRQIETPSFHPRGPAPYGVLSADQAKQQCDNRFRNGGGSWADILVEEVAEALEEQVAAVALRWIRKLDIEATS
jgi:hypothetical protein